jgi:hypothetical protein
MIRASPGSGQCARFGLLFTVIRARRKVNGMRDAMDVIVTPKLVEQILDAEGNLIGIETAHIEDALEQFRQLALRSGQSVYLWDPENGIAALRQSELRVPGSKRFNDALRFILQSMQFGVYLLIDFEDQIKPPNTSLLRRFARIRSGNQRKIVFLARKLNLPEEIDSLVERMSTSAKSSAPPRLRDGRWVR